MNEWSVKNVREFDGVGGPGLSCSLYLGRKRVAMVINNADGRPYTVKWLGKGAPVNELVFEQAVEDAGPYLYQGKKTPMTADVFLNLLVLDYEEEKVKKTHCRTRILYRKPGEFYGVGEWDSVTQPFTHTVVFKLRQRYGNDTEICNFKYGEPR